VVDEVSEAEGTPVAGDLRRLICERLDVLGGEEVQEGRWRELFDNLRDAGHFRDALGAKLVLAALWDDEEARSLLLEQALSEVQAREEEVPERFRARFWQIPVYRRLVEAVDGSAAPEPEVVEAPELGEAVNEDKLDWRQSPGYPRWRKRYSKIVGEDRRLLEALRRVDRVAPGETAVLITGESGTGKELIAEAIHERSGRSGGPFVKVNCAAFVEELLLSELFGHEKGAFTGAVSEKSGRFERAHGGTIFLDEIGDISPKTQVALLRVLQDGVFERVGGTKTRSADVRVVAATNRPLEEMVESGKFRLDLYYRLKGFVLEMPPLRDRREDVPALLRHFAELSAGDSAPRFAPEASQYLARYSWPGNIRELENFVRSVLLFVEGDEVTMDHLGQFRDFFSGEHREDLPEISVEIPLDELEIAEPEAMASLSEEALVDEVLSEELSLSEMKDRLERLCIERALRSTGGNITRAAEKLQMKRPRLSQIINGTPELLALKEELVG
jgi:transcriptional regulator with GAF, ATPase, and Fis domain